MEKSLEKFYHNELLPQLNELEKEKKKHLIIPVILSSIVISIGVILINNGVPFQLAIFGVIIFLVLSFLFSGYLFKPYKIKFKKLIVKPLVQFVNPEFNYCPEWGITNAEFKSCGIFRTHNRFKSEDLIIGTLDKSKFQYSEIDAKYESGSGKNRSVKTIFKGVLLIADFNKHFNGKTYVRTDVAEKFFGKLIGNSLQKIFSTASLVKLENQEFEQEFVVKSTDPVEARYILTPSLMDRMMRLRRKHGKIQFSFIEEKMYIAIPSNKDRFEPSMFNRLDNYSLIKDFYDEVTTIVDIIEELNLNTRIWTKE